MSRKSEKILTYDCDMQCERYFNRILTSLETIFKEHYLLFQSAVVEQNEILDAMDTLCQRFLILTRGIPCVRPYPRLQSDQEEKRILDKFNSKKKRLHKIRTKLTASLHNLKDKCGAFDLAMSKIDASLPSTIIEGNETRQPIYYFIELYADLFRFFDKIQNKLKILEKFLTVEDISAILEYKSLLEPDVVVNEYFEKCLHIDKPNK